MLLTHIFIGKSGYVALGLVVAWKLPSFGHRVLAFLRDLRAFRDGH